jgi:GGDEF domain-containing protein
MISIKKFLSDDHHQSAEAYERMALLLLQAMGLHAVEGDRMDYDRFRASISVLQSAVAEDPSPHNILATAASAVKTLGDHNWRTSQFIRAKGIELQAIVGMLTSSMSQISSASKASIDRLQELQKQIEHASMVEDVRTLKLRLSDCLVSIRGECDRQRGDADLAVEEMKSGLQKAQETKPIETSPNGDPLTGFMLRSGAEEAMRTACAAKAHVYAGLFVMDRIQTIVSRFGAELGDRALLFFVQHLSSALNANDAIFRWSPTAFVALMNRGESPELVRRQIAKTMAQRREQTFEIGDRSVVLPISCSWVVMPLFEQPYADIVRKLDAFGAAKS